MKSNDMIIPVTLSTDPNAKLPTGLAQISHDEILLIELQGALDIGNSHPTERNGQFVGKLSVDDGLKKATLLIGHHLLEGKIMPIAKPLAILHRTNTTTPKNSDTSAEKDVDCEHSDSMDVDRGDEQQGPPPLPQWIIVGLVKKKIAFSKRPTPVLNRA